MMNYLRSSGRLGRIGVIIGRKVKAIIFRARVLLNEEANHEVFYRII